VLAKVLGAPAAHTAAAAQRTQQPMQQQQAPAVTLPLPLLPLELQQMPSSVLPNASMLPLQVTADGVSYTPGTQLLRQQQHAGHQAAAAGPDAASSEAGATSSRLQWHGTTSEARLVERLGMTQAVQRFRALAARSQAAAQAAEADGG
jgi:hypothetical protein